MSSFFEPSQYLNETGSRVFLPNAEPAVFGKTLNFYNNFSIRIPENRKKTMLIYHLLNA